MPSHRVAGKRKQVNICNMRGCAHSQHCVKCWLFADVFWKPSILSAALALANTSFLSLSLNLNCKGSAFSQGTRVEGHCGVLGRISQVSTPHPWPPPSGWSGSVPTWSSSPGSGHFLLLHPVQMAPMLCGPQGRGVQGWMLLPCLPAGGAGDRVPHRNCLFVRSFTPKIPRMRPMQ